MSSDPLFQGMTRPAMLAGVTYSGVILNLMAVVVPFVLVNKLWVLLLAVPIHGAMWVVCRWDARFFDLVLSWAQTTGRAKLRYIWKGSSYRP